MRKADRSEDHLIEQSVIDYFKNVQATLEEFESLEPEEKDSLLLNVYREIDGKEMRLACHNYCSQILEKIVDCSNGSQIRVFLNRMQDHFWHMSRNRFASHVLQRLLNASFEVIREESAQKSEPQKLLSCTQLIVAVYEELEPELVNAFTDPFASHVLRTLFIILSGGKSEVECLLRSEGSKSFQKQNKISTSVPLEHLSAIPQPFSDAMNRCTGVLLEQFGSFHELVFDKVASPTLQLLLSVCPSQVCDKILAQILAESSADRVKFVEKLSFDKIGSHFLQAVIRKISKESLLACFASCFRGRVVEFLTDPIANYVLQEVISATKSEEIFLDILRELSAPSTCSTLPVRKKIPIFVKAAETARRFGKGFSALFRLIRKSFKLKKSSTSRLVHLLLAADSDNRVDLPSSLLLQRLFFFPPKYLTRIEQGMFELSSKELEAIACNRVTSHVLEAFFQGNFLPAAKGKVLDTLSDSLVKLCCDKYASHVVEKIWDCFSVAKKAEILSRVAPHKKLLLDSAWGTVLLHKFHMEEFVYSRERWQSRFSQLQKKKRLLDDIFGGK